MNRLLSCEPWPVSKLTVLLSQFLEGIIHFLSLFAAGFFAAGFFVSALARGFAAGFAAALAAGFLAAAFFFGASSPSSLGAGATLSFFGRGPMVGLALSARISVMRSTVSSSR